MDLMTADVDCVFGAAVSPDVDGRSSGFGALAGWCYVDVDDAQTPFVENDVPLIDAQILWVGS